MPTSSDDPDLSLLIAITALRAGGPVSSESQPTVTSPHLAVLELYELELMRASAQVHDIKALGAAAGDLSLLMPMHPDSLQLQLIAGALATTLDEQRLLQLIQPRPRQPHEIALLQALIPLVPDREMPLLRVAMRMQPNCGTEQVLQTLVGITHDGGADVLGTVQSCIDENLASMAIPLIPQLPQPLQASYGRTIRITSGDMAELARLGTVDPQLMPHCSPVQIHHGLICFHLSNAIGSLPRSGVVIKLNGAVVPATSLHRIGTLYGIKPSLHGPVQLQVLAGAGVIMEQTVQL